jgi:MSHA biogenesis protein MshJ
MKQLYLKLAARIDALSLRERGMVFGAAAAAIVFVGYHLMLSPLFAKQAGLRAQIAQQQNNIGGIDAEITQKLQAFAADPDASGRARLAAVKTDIEAMGNGLRTMQKGLVAPDRIVPLLELILKSNGRLRLLSMKTLPVSSLNDAAAKAAPDAAPIVKPSELLYRHGVELSVRGNYLDMVNYMSALEAMPTQLFWGKAQLEVEEYPNARLTLTLYTLSLDRKWMKL